MYCSPESPESRSTPDPTTDPTYGSPADSPAAAPRSVFPGERTSSAADFAQVLTEFAPELPESSWSALFLRTSGHILAGQAVLQGIRTLGHDPSNIDADRFPDVLSTDVLNQIRSLAPDCPELRLAHLLSYVRTINTDTIDIAVSAMPYLGSYAVPTDPEDREQLDGAELTARLAEEGLLLPTLNRAGEYEMPPVLSTILRRVYDAKDRHSESRSRRALGAASAEVLEASASYHSPAFGEALAHAADSGHWSVLTKIWAARAHTLFLDHFDAAIAAYSKAPESQTRTSAVLAEAKGDAEQIDEARKRLHTNDATAVLSEVNFDHAAVPSLEPRINRLKQDAGSVDDILSMSIASMRRLRHIGEPIRAMDFAKTARSLITDSRRCSQSPSRLYEARFHLEQGITAIFAGDIAGSLALLRRSIIITELAAASSPCVLLPANAYSALAHSILGNGGSSDEHLRAFDALVERTHLRGPEPAEADTLARMIRAMNTLDLDTAYELSSHLDDPSFGHHTWIVTALYRTMLGILRGDVGVEEKRLKQALETNQTPLPEGDIRLVSLKLITVYLHLAQGRTHLAQNELKGSSMESPHLVLAKARIHLSIGEYGSAGSLVSRILSLSTVDLHTQASARAVQAASLLGNGHLQEADSAFADTLEYCKITSGLLPVLLIPKLLRDRLIERSMESNEWALIAQRTEGTAPHGSTTPSGSGTSSSGADSHSGIELRDRLLSLGETLRIGTGHILLSSDQTRLLALLDAGASISEIAAELGLVEGTVKNKLSGLYSRLTVRNRRDAVAKAYEYGYLPVDD